MLGFCKLRYHGVSCTGDVALTFYRIAVKYKVTAGSDDEE